MWILGSAIAIDRHIIAGISIIGTVCDVMGGLYLAYDLLGGNIDWLDSPINPVLGDSPECRGSVSNAKQNTKNERKHKQDE